MPKEAASLFELSIATRHITARRRQTLLSVTAVALAVSISIIFTSLANGQQQLLTGIVIEKLPHVTVTPRQGDDYIHLYKSLLDKVRSMSGVKSQAVSLSTTATFSYKDRSKNVLLRGVVPADEDQILKISPGMVQGDFYGVLARRGAAIGQTLADDLNIKLGDKVLATFPKAVPVELSVVGIFNTGTPLDEAVAFVSLSTAREFLDEGDVINSVEIQLYDIDQAGDAALEISDLGYRARSWQETNPEIQRTITIGGFFTRLSILLAMVVAFFGIANIMNLLVVEKTKEIGMLISMGATRANIRNIFILESGLLGLIGALAGCAMGLIATLSLGNLRFEIAAGGREITTIPLALNPWDFAAFTFLALSLSIAAGAYPARKASQLDPVIALKGG